MRSPSVLQISRALRGTRAGRPVALERLLRVKGQPQTPGAGEGELFYSVGASAQPDTVTLCGSWVPGVTGGDWDRSPGL